MAKMRVEIISENEIKKKKCKVDGNKIIIKSGGKGRGNVEYAPTFTKNSILTYRTGIFPFRFLKQKVQLMKDANACIDYEFVGDKAIVNVPTVTREDITRMFKAEVLKAAGTLTNKLQVPMTLYIMGIAGVIVNVLVLMVITGRIRI